MFQGRCVHILLTNNHRNYLGFRDLQWLHRNQLNLNRC
nr:MAG TPA: hypothetical protein [Caudoviricetes sp.]